MTGPVQSWPPSVTGAGLAETLEKRRTVREFSSDALALDELMTLLWSGQGISGADGQRMAPSAGAMYPIRLFVLAGAVSELACGLHAYDPARAALDPYLVGDLRAPLAEAALEEQPWVAAAAAVVVVAADVTAMTEHFEVQPPRGERGARYAYMETGAVAQNIHLTATAMDLGVVLVGGFDDRAVEAVLRLPDPLEPTALLCVGKPAGDA